MNSRPSGALVAILAISLMAGTALGQDSRCPVGADPKHVVVTIAINDYAHPERFGHLDSPVPDANSIESLLLHNFGYRSYIELADSKGATPPQPLRGTAANKDAIDSLIDGLSSVLCKQDDLIFFFSGHGTFKPNPDDPKQPSKGYIVPYDAGAVGYEGAHLIGVKELLENLNDLPAKHILVILDACHSGIALKDALEGMKTPTDEVRGQDRVQSEEEKYKSRKVIVSALADQTASDALTGGNSLFATTLLIALGGRAAGQKKFIDDYDIGTFLRQNVSGSEGHPQTPDFAPFADNEGGSLVLPLDLNLASLYHSAFASLMKGDLDDFRARSTQAIARDPGDVRTMALRYRLALTKGDAEDAAAAVGQLYQFYRKSPPPPGTIGFNKLQDLQNARDQIAFWRNVLGMPRAPGKPPVTIHAYSGKTEQAQNLTELSTGSGEFIVQPDVENLWFKLKAASAETYVYAFFVDAAGLIHSKAEFVRARQNPVGPENDVLSMRQDAPAGDDFQEWHFIFSQQPIDKFASPPSDSGGGDDPPTAAELAGCIHYVLIVRPETE